MAVRTNNLRWLLIAAVLLGMAWAVWHFWPLREHSTRMVRIKVPEVLLLEDFQRPLDRDLTAQLLAFENTQLIQSFEGKVLKPFVDDVNSIHLSVSAVEVRPGQFPDRPELSEIVAECAKILKIPTPKVYVINRSERNVFATNFKEPVIVICSGLLDTSINPRELRFLIGREMGHIRCGHVKWQVVLHSIADAVRASKIVPNEVGLAPFLPVFKWSREAEMSADAAGLICCQDLDTAEQALARMAHGGSPAELGRINVDAFLAQSETNEFSTFAEVVQYWRELVREHPFVPERIRELRRYAATRNYQHLWE